MKYSALKKHMSRIIKQMAKQNHVNILAAYNKSSRVSFASKNENRITIGVSDIWNKDNIMFTDAVSYIITTFHECQHAIDFYGIRHGDTSNLLRSFCSEYDNNYYYMGMYYHSDLELNAQYNALLNSREYLYDVFPGHNDAIDQHILYWGKKWFENPEQNASCSFDFSRYDKLDDFLQAFEEYKNNHWINAKPIQYDFTQDYSDHIYHIMRQHLMNDRIHSYDFCFQNIDDAKLQQVAAFLINAETNDELGKLVPAIKDENLLSEVRQNLLYNDAPIDFDDYDFQKQ